jgi:AraC family transcriptional regulator
MTWRMGGIGPVARGARCWHWSRLSNRFDCQKYDCEGKCHKHAVARRSPAHFSRKFKLAVGDPPHAYVVRRRLEKACHLMMTSAEPLSEIALSVGFSDQAHLCRLFRQAFGRSPANWRRNHEILGEVTSRAGIDENIP